jgi:hypothetical protein
MLEKRNKFDPKKRFFLQGELTNIHILRVDNSNKN